MVKAAFASEIRNRFLVLRKNSTPSRRFSKSLVAAMIGIFSSRRIWNGVSPLPASFVFPLGSPAWSIGRVRTGNSAAT